MKHTILNCAGDLLGTIDISPERAAEIADAKSDAPSEDGIWHFCAGDWLDDSEIEAVGTSHENEIQIVSIDRPGFILCADGPVGSTKAEGGNQ